MLATLLNAPKPLHIDDTAYRIFADQAAAHPLDPFGFRIFWDQQPQPSMEIAAPPVVPYWLGLGTKLFGARPILWKAWFFPFVLLFAASFHRLLRRFGRGLETPLLWMTLFSPAFLPGLNLMLDVPALGVYLLAIVLFLDSLGTGSLRLAALAGTASGLAILTKYSALLGPVVLATFALLHRRPRAGLVAAGVALAVFVAWEGAVWSRYGMCQFVFSVFHFPHVLPKSQVAPPAVAYLGGLAPGALLLGLFVLGARTAVVFALGVLTILIIVGSGVLPQRGADLLDLTSYLYLSGAALLAVVIVAAARMGARRLADPFTRMPGRMLAAWLLLELAGCIVFSPFMAARRVMTLIVVATLILGRYGALTLRAPSRRRGVLGIAGYSVALGLFFGAVDFREAAAQRDGVEQAARWIEAQKSGGAVWYIGHWGFQHYAEAERMSPVVPEESSLREGDWLVIPDVTLCRQRLTWPHRAMDVARVIELDDALPFHTVMGYYAGTSPLERRRGPRLTVQVYRVRSGFIPGRG